jgi:ABC-type dipeptide/oligopeptide/nickel transport system ATPase component
MLDSPVARIEDLRVKFPTRDRTTAGVEELSRDLHPGRTVCRVGESRSGKSVSALSMMRSGDYDGAAITGGRVLFGRRSGGATELARTLPAAMRNIRGNEIGMIFREQVTALDPVVTIGRRPARGRGAVVETPRYPYTKAVLHAVPLAAPARRRSIPRATRPARRLRAGRRGSRRAGPGDRQLRKERRPCL